mgnify:FL=1
MYYNLQYVNLAQSAGGDKVNADFPRIITLLRKERKISQKQAAADLGVSQALLSHYEKGVRECGLDFLVKVADYYNVSCDYLLGRSPDPVGKTISYEDIPEPDGSKKERLSPSEIMSSFSKKLIISSVNVLFSILQKAGSDTLTKESSSFLMLAIYRIFRIAYSSNPENDQLFFTIPEVCASSCAASAMAMCEANAAAAAKGVKLSPTGDFVKEENAPLITTASLSEEFPAHSSSILNLIKNSEAKIHLLNNPQK